MGGLKAFGLFAVTMYKDKIRKHVMQSISAVAQAFPSSVKREAPPGGPLSADDKMRQISSIIWLMEDF